MPLKLPTWWPLHRSHEAKLKGKIFPRLFIQQPNGMNRSIPLRFIPNDQYISTIGKLLESHEPATAVTYTIGQEYVRAQYPMHNPTNSQISRFQKEVVPILGMCYEYRHLSDSLGCWIENKWVDLIHPLFQELDISHHFFVITDDEAENWIAKLYTWAESTSPDCSNCKHIYHILKIFLEDLMEGLQVPEHSPPNYVGLIRLAMELGLLEAILLSTHKSFQTGKTVVIQLLNHKFWYPIFTRFFPTRYANINLWGYRGSEQLFPIPGTPLWLQRDWNDLWRALRNQDNERPFKNDYLALIQYIQRTYHSTVFTVLARHFRNENAFFSGLEGFTQSAITKAPYDADTEWFVRRLKKKCFVKVNRPHGGDKATADLIGLVAFAHALLEVERVITETITRFLEKSRTVPTLIQCQTMNIAMVISKILWRPAQRHVFALVKAEDKPDGWIDDPRGGRSTIVEIGPRVNDDGPGSMNVPQANSIGDILVQEQCGRCRRFITIVSWLQSIPPNDMPAKCPCQIFVSNNGND